MNRVCTKCRASKPIEAFSPAKRGRDGLNSWCKACVSAASAAIAVRKYADDPAFREDRKARSRAWLASRTPEQREAIAERRRMWARANRAQKYGLTLEEFEAMLEAQGGDCAICSTRMLSPCIDHDHVTKEVRGLLCMSCNTALGHFRDDPSIVRSALAYLSRVRLVKREPGNA